MSHPQSTYSNRFGGSSRSPSNSHNARLHSQLTHVQETSHAMGGDHHTYNLTEANSAFDEDAAFYNNPAQHESTTSPADARYVKVPRRFGGDSAGPRPLNENPHDPSEPRGHASRFPHQRGYLAANPQSHHDQSETYSGGVDYGTRAAAARAQQQQRQPEPSAAWSGLKQEQHLDPCHDFRSMGHTAVAEKQHSGPYDSVGYVRSDGLVYNYEKMYQEYRSSNYDD